MPTDASEQLREASIRSASAVREGPIGLGGVFIVYSHVDSEFVDALEARPVADSIPFWRDVHELGAGSSERQIAEAIRLYDYEVLVLSSASINSDWVQWEAAEALRLERERGRSVLCPIALDESWKDSHWPGPIRDRILHYNVLNFAHWRDPAELEISYQRLIAGLRLFY